MSADEGAGGTASDKQMQLALAVAMEPDLRALKGLTTVLRYLSERAPSELIEPAALAALIVPAEDAVDRLLALMQAGTRDDEEGRR
jgi:hypothetical protein